MEITLKNGMFVTMDKNGKLCIYNDKPKKGEHYWMSLRCWYLDPTIFNIPDLGPWEDSLHIVDNGQLIKFIELPNLAVDTPVWVTSAAGSIWVKRHFAKWNDTGQICCWLNGQTSFTSTGSINVWLRYSLTDPELDK